MAWFKRPALAPRSTELGKVVGEGVGLDFRDIALVPGSVVHAHAQHEMSRRKHDAVPFEPGIVGSDDQARARSIAQPDRLEGE